MRKSPFLLSLVVAGAATFAACGDGADSGSDSTRPTSVGPAPTDDVGSTTSTASTDPVVDPGDGGNYAPTLDPADFVEVIDNPFLPMPVGATWRFEGESDGEVETVEITVTDERRTVLGISAVVVRDVVRIDGEIVEDTRDWFAQDKNGNVWYLGEAVADYENGKLVSTAGSWEAGVDGAFPGIVMPADPQVGDQIRQEFYPGEAEDMMKIVAVGESLTVPAGSFDDVITTHDWTPLEPEVIEAKYYQRGVGKIREEKIAGGDGLAELVEYSLP